MCSPFLLGERGIQDQLITDGVNARRMITIDDSLGRLIQRNLGRPAKNTARVPVRVVYDTYSIVLYRPRHCIIVFNNKL